MPLLPYKEIGMPTELLTTKEAAKFLKISTVTLEKWRCQERGPQYVKLGRAVRYEREALQRYIEENSIEAS
jgi:excisionase family DNA binding protein